MSRKNGFDFFSALYELSDKAYSDSLALYEIYSSGGFCESRELFDCRPLLNDFSQKLNSEFFTSVDREDIFYLSCLTGRLCRDIIFPFNKIKSLEFFTPNESLSEIFRMLPTSINTLSDIFKEFSLFPKCRKLFAYAENIQKLSDSEGQLYFSVLKNLSSGKNQDLITYDLAASAHGIFNDAIKISEYSIYTLIKNT